MNISCMHTLGKLRQISVYSVIWDNYKLLDMCGGWLGGGGGVRWGGGGIS